MATELTKPIIRDTGLTVGKKPVFVTLIPTKDGGAIVLKEKGKRGKGTTVPLKTLLEPREARDEEPVQQKRKPIMHEFEDPRTADLVDLGGLESRIMIDGEEMMTPAVKGRVWAIIREIREERREEFGLKKVHSGRTKRKK
jgi:hypothetical protein